MERLGQWMPAELGRVAVALAVVVVGYLLARIIRYFVTRLFRGATSHFVSLSQRAHDHAGLVPGSETMTGAQEAAIQVSGRVAFWLVFTLFLGAGAAVLGFPVLSSWLEGLAAYLPRVLAAVAIVLLGVLSGLLLRAMVTAAARSSSPTLAASLGRGAQIAVVMLAAVMAIEELGIGITLLVVIAAIVLGSSLGAAALAFGLGAKSSVTNILACHYLSKWYRVGQIVRIGDNEGRIVQIQPGAVVLQTKAGKLYIPAHNFADIPSLLIADAEDE